MIFHYVWTVPSTLSQPSSWQGWVQVWGTCLVIPTWGDIYDQSIIQTEVIIIIFCHGLAGVVAGYGSIIVVTQSSRIIVAAFHERPWDHEHLRNWCYFHCWQIKRKSNFNTVIWRCYVQLLLVWIALLPIRDQGNCPWWRRLRRLRCWLQSPRSPTGPYEGAGIFM